MGSARGATELRTASSQRPRHSRSSPPQARTNSRVVSHDGNREPVAASCSVVCEIEPETPAIRRKDGFPALARNARRSAASCLIVANRVEPSSDIPATPRE